MDNLDTLRTQIDEIDEQILTLFKSRMGVAEQIADYKASSGLPVLDKSREREKLIAATQAVPEELRDYTAVLMSLIMEVSRARQHSHLDKPSITTEQITHAIQNTPSLFPQMSYVACQGVEGAYSQIAADRLFKHPSISYFDTFEAVFRAIEDGFCTYGLLPLENSTAGSVNQVYDLMMEHKFFIARSLRLRVDHALLAQPKTELSDIKEIYSHAQAIDQCSKFLETLKGVQVHVCENTAMAARMVAESERSDLAALSSKNCADLYGLSVLDRDVQDSTNNYTRFACISKNLEIYPGANRTSLMMIISHEPGQLYKVLARFYALDINLVKLESRPIPGHDFEFMFYFDIDCDVSAPEFTTLMNSLDDVCEEYRYLGSYSELI